MYKLTKLINFSGEADNAARAAVAARLQGLTGDIAVLRALISPTLSGVYNGGDLIAHFQFADEAAGRAFDSRIVAALDDRAVAHVDSAAYTGIAGAVAEPGLKQGVYRTLFLTIDRPVGPDVIARFEAEMQQMPHHIPAIRNWQLSRVADAAGARRWTHVWEQEYASIDGLMGPYTMHPYHWGLIDRWYDPECADWIVNTHLCHSFCAFEGSVI